MNNSTRRFRSVRSYYFQWSICRRPEARIEWDMLRSLFMVAGCKARQFIAANQNGMPISPKNRS